MEWAWLLRKWMKERHENGKCVSVERTEPTQTEGNITALPPRGGGMEWNICLRCHWTDCQMSWHDSGIEWTRGDMPYPNHLEIMCIRTIHRTILQGVPRLLSQLSEALISVYVDGIKYNFNHLIPTLGDFVWHMKHHHTLNGSQDIKGNSFWWDFCKTDFCP